MNQTNSKLLTTGIIAGPFFIVVSLLQAFTREGFDMVRHPASLLSLGDWGWIQIANFVLTGLLFIALGIGLREVLTSGVGSRWASILFIIVGVAMIGGGVFLADPSLGFPPGAPEGVPKENSWHALVHGFAPIFGFLALIAALFILARRFGSQGQRTWMRVTTSSPSSLLFYPLYQASLAIGRQVGLIFCRSGQGLRLVTDIRPWL
jgi:Protein of unknown function (DUF998)